MNVLSHHHVQEAIAEKKKKGRNMTSDERKWCVAEEKRRHELIRSCGKELTAISLVICHNTTSRYFKLNPTKTNVKQHFDILLTYFKFFRTITGEARDALVELIMKNCKYDELNWAEICLKGK